MQRWLASSATLAFGLLWNRTMHDVAGTESTKGSHKEVVLRLKPLVFFIVYMVAASKSAKDNK
jgi:hypothetical protein